MAWSHTIFEGDPGCPGKLVLSLPDGLSEIVIHSYEDGLTRRFPCSFPALLGVQRGTRTHLASAAGECVLSKEADGVHVTVKDQDKEFRFFCTSNDYLLALTKLLEAKVLQRKITLK